MDYINQNILSFGKDKQGILQIVGAVLAFLLTLGTIIHLFNIAGFLGVSSYPVFAEIVYSLCKVLAAFCSMIGFCVFGIMLLLNPKHVLTVIALGALAFGAFFASLEDLFYYLWQNASYYSYYFNYPYLFAALISLLTAVAWAFPTVAAGVRNNAMFCGITLIMLVFPGALFLVYFFAAIFTATLSFNTFLYQLMQYALMAGAVLLVLCSNGKPAAENLREMNKANAAQRYEEAQRTRPGQTAYASAQQQTQSASSARPQSSASPIQPDAYIGIVKLVVLSIFTLGIYVYIWVYKTSRYFDTVLNRQGSFSPGVEVVLCLFVPFYFLYWIYKQSKAADEAHKCRGNFGNNDLPVINLLLAIFGLGIIAYALLQDQINKLCLGYTAPPNYERPQQTVNASQQRRYGYNFDPVTGEPIRKEEKEATAQEPTTEAAFAEEKTVSSPGTEGTVAEEREAFDSDPEIVAEQLENLRILKQLLDSGVLTQEEFEEKKKHILGL